MIYFASCFVIGKANGWGDIPKMQGRIWLSPCPRPLIFENPPTLGLYIYTKQMIAKEVLTKQMEGCLVTMIKMGAGCCW